MSLSGNFCTHPSTNKIEVQSKFTKQQLYNKLECLKKLSLEEDFLIIYPFLALIDLGVILSKNLWYFDELTKFVGLTPKIVLVLLVECELPPTQPNKATEIASRVNMYH